MSAHFYLLDWGVLAVYFAAMAALGFVLRGKARSSEGFTAGDRSMSGLLCGLSIFATYLSSISYLALPGKSFAADWNPFVFSLAVPITTWIAVRWFLPYYRRYGEVSAYALLEKRFGTWARLYAGTFYLLFQLARIGIVLYLMALPMAVIFGWDMRAVIVVTGVCVVGYSLMGGIRAVIWADAIQAVVLLVGAVFALIVIWLRLPQGPAEMLSQAAQDGKLALGSMNPLVVSQATFWVVLAYGIVENLKNFGIDQSYIQRYIAARDEREAKAGLWLGGLLYLPVSALFFLIGTSLFYFYQSRPGEIPEVKQIVARQRLLQQGIRPPESDVDVSPQARLYDERLQEVAEGLKPQDIGDRVFPHFIAKHLPPGITGLLIAAVFAAAMSTVSTSLNSSATLIMTDFYRRFLDPDAPDRRLVFVLRAATTVWGVLGIATALALVRLTESVLDIWWTLSSVLSGGIVGLFLLGRISRKADNRSGAPAVAVGLAAIAWMVLSASDWWPLAWSRFRSPFHAFLVTVLGTAVILGVGMAAAAILPTVRTTRVGSSDAN
ncbi:MAG: sodium:solute symporter [Thermogutta sp.]|nr:sodium:solute symporter [Thermogutta sp.]